MRSRFHDSLPRLPGRLALALVAIALLAGAGGTYAASQSSSSPPDPTAERQAFLNDVAKQLKVSPSALTAAIKKALSDRVDAAVAAGRITKAQGDAIKQRLQQSPGLPPVGFGFGGPRMFEHPEGTTGPYGATGPEGPGEHFGPMGGFAFHMGPLNAAAQYLGLSDAQLGQELQSGKSLAQVATEHHKSVDGLKQALIGAARNKLDAAVKAGMLTSAQEQQLLSRLTSGLDAVMQRRGPPVPWDGGPPGAPPRFGPFRLFQGRPGFRDFRGGPPGGPPPVPGFAAPGGPPGGGAPGSASS